MKKLLEVKKQIGVLKKNSKNPFFKSAYLDLNDLLNAVEPLLLDNGLILLQPVDDNKVYTMIIDAETEHELCNSSMAIPDNITDPQKLGSCITYFRRYTLKSLLAIAETDDDGNLASKKSKPVLSDDRFTAALEKLESGYIKKESITNNFKLTQEQINKLK
jgi:hypothetical protein